MAARKGPHFEMSAEHRVKIQNSNILNALIEHVAGDREMSSTQVSAGLGLLRKVLPDLMATTHSGDPENPQIIEHRNGADRFIDGIHRIASRGGVGAGAEKLN